MYNVVWPRGKSVAGEGHFARRLDTLNGKKIGIVSDYVGDDVLESIEKALQERYPSVKIYSKEHFGNTHGGDEKTVVAELPKKLKELQIDAVVSGVAL